MLDLRGFVAETNATHLFLVQRRRRAHADARRLPRGHHARDRARALPRARDSPRGRATCRSPSSTARTRCSAPARWASSRASRRSTGAGSATARRADDAAALGALRRSGPPRAARAWWTDARARAAATLLGALRLRGLRDAAAARRRRRPRGRGRCGGEPAFAAGGERATLWFRHSAEFRAASEIIYRAAATALARGTRGSRPGRPNRRSPATCPHCRPPSSWTSTKRCSTTPSRRREMMLEGTCFEEFPTGLGRLAREAQRRRRCRARRNSSAPPALMKDPPADRCAIFFITNRECARAAGQRVGLPATGRHGGEPRRARPRQRRRSRTT